MGDNFGMPCDGFQRCLEGGRFLAIGVPQSLVARGELKDAFSGGIVVSAGFFHQIAQDLPVALRGDRQAMVEIPGRKAAFIRVVAKLDLAALQRLSVG